LRSHSFVASLLADGFRKHPFSNESILFFGGVNILSNSFRYEDVMISLCAFQLFHLCDYYLNRCHVPRMYVPVQHLSSKLWIL
jgi:hypothetical protein